MIWKISHPGQIRNLLLGYKAEVEGSSLERGKLYSNLPMPQFDDIPFYRDNKDRVQFIKENLKDYNKLIDLGCNMGQMIFWLYEEGKQYYGLDYDENAIMIANKLREVFLPKSEIQLATGSILYNFPICDNSIHLFLSTFQWIVKKHGLKKSKELLIALRGSIGDTNTLFFETSGSDSMAPLPEADNKEWIINLLNECGWKVEKERLLKADTGGDRWIFKCSCKQ